MADADKRAGWLKLLTVGQSIMVDPGPEPGTIQEITPTGRINVTLNTGALVKFAPSGISYLRFPHQGQNAPKTLVRKDLPQYRPEPESEAAEAPIPEAIVPKASAGPKVRDTFQPKHPSPGMHPDACKHNSQITTGGTYKHFSTDKVVSVIGQAQVNWTRAAIWLVQDKSSGEQFLSFLTELGPMKKSGPKH